MAAVGGEVQRCLAPLILRALSPSPPRLHFAQSLKQMASMRAQIGARGRIGWAASRQTGAGALKVLGATNHADMLQSVPSLRPYLEVNLRRWGRICEQGFLDACTHSKAGCSAERLFPVSEFLL